MPPRGEGPCNPAAASPAPPVPPRRIRSRDKASGRTPKSGLWGNGGEQRRVKCVFVGDGAVGKTSLVVSYTTNGYPTEYVPTAFDNFTAVVSVDGQPVQLQLCDTAGQDEFDKLRPLCYTDADVFLLCFSVVSPASFQNVPEKWVPEIRRHAPCTPLVLVGTQCDLREDVKVLIELAKYRERPVEMADAVDCAAAIGAEGYMECSSLTQQNLKAVFDMAIVASLQDRGAGPARGGAKRQRRRRRQQQTAPGRKDPSKSWWRRYCCVA